MTPTQAQLDAAEAWLLEEWRKRLSDQRHEGRVDFGTRDRDAWLEERAELATSIRAVRAMRPRPHPVYEAQALPAMTGTQIFDTLLRDMCVRSAVGALDAFDTFSPLATETPFAWPTAEDVPEAIALGTCSARFLAWADKDVEISPHQRSREALFVSVVQAVVRAARGDQDTHYYSINDEGHITQHPSADNAKKEAEQLIEYRRADASTDGWPEDESMTLIQWGRLVPIQICVQTDLKKRPEPKEEGEAHLTEKCTHTADLECEECEEWSGSYDYTCSYKLRGAQ